MVDTHRVTRACGLAAPVIALGAIFLSTCIASPETFTWRNRALSDMGRPGTETFWVFNGGLILAGVIGIPFVHRVWDESTNRLERVGAGMLGVSLAGMIGVGLFFLEHTTYYLSTDLHGPAALTTFAAAPIAAIGYGLGAYRAGTTHLAVASLAAGTLQLASWIVWGAYVHLLASTSTTWFAVPEFVAAGCLGAWVVVLAIESVRSRADSVPTAGERDERSRAE
ncbi:DUF998 domain-containing protein [Halovivax gelatinilyticus]|uniref:DUF998 domain-containing protein n=1 Tax=Halovivax gelatinilyticus TaxID=2961597 RepID=UPI0020CA88D1|nr:DUF998 domain-containing protein [Halovivax gelatinilyticus]